MGDEYADDARPDTDDARRSADEEIQRRMAETGYDVRSAYGRMLVKVVAQVVAGDLGMLVAHDHLFARARRLHARLEQPAPPSWPDAAPSLIYEAVERGAPRFVGDKLRCWDPTRGASLRTYATNFVLMNDFCSVYRRYHRVEAPRPQECTLSPELVDRIVVADGGRDPLDTVLYEDVLRCLRSGCFVSRQARGVEPMDIVLHRCRGMTNGRIAEQMGIPRRAVGEVLHQFRGHLCGVHGWSEREGAGR